MMKLMYMILITVVFFVNCHEIIAADVKKNIFQRHRRNIASRKPSSSCTQVCEGIIDGCKYVPLSPTATSSSSSQEVIMVTNGDPNIEAWKWDAVTMVISPFNLAVRTSCVAHSNGKRFGLIVPVPDDISKISMDAFSRDVQNHQQILMADHIVFDLLNFFIKYEKINNTDEQDHVITNLKNILSRAASTVLSSHNREVICIVPWQPPCLDNCTTVKLLLDWCGFLLLSPDSYNPKVPSNGNKCIARATVPISRFLYGIDRYTSLRLGKQPSLSIIAGIPWHGYTYKCDQNISENKCFINAVNQSRCFSEKNRQKHSLSEIHTANYPAEKQIRDEVNKAVFYNVNLTEQLWYEDFASLSLKYQLVKDLQLRGLSIWYGEDMTTGMSDSKAGFAFSSWSFLTHNMIHKLVHSPSKSNHYYADTVAGIGIGCLLLGTALGVIFTCIAFKRRNFRQRHRPFKLDETDNFRDDEGL